MITGSEAGLCVRIAAILHNDSYETKYLRVHHGKALFHSYALCKICFGLFLAGAKALFFLLVGRDIDLPPGTPLKSG
jgi:hypothetical protein